MKEMWGGCREGVRGLRRMLRRYGVGERRRWGGRREDADGMCSGPGEER